MEPLAVWEVNDRFLSERIVESQHSLELKDWIFKNKCKCSVLLNSCGKTFWMTEEERTKTTNDFFSGGTTNTAIGYPIGSKSLSNKPVMDTKFVTVTFTIVTTKDNADTIKNIAWNLTQNNVGESLPTFGCHPAKEQVYYMMGVYKRPGFDQAYVYNLNVNGLTETEFAKINGTWDSALVECRLFDGMKDCVGTYRVTKAVTSQSLTTVLVHFLEIDIEKNMDSIKGMLTDLCSIK